MLGAYQMRAPKVQGGILKYNAGGTTRHVLLKQNAWGHYQMCAPKCDFYPVPSTNQIKSLEENSAGIHQLLQVILRAFSLVDSCSVDG